MSPEKQRIAIATACGWTDTQIIDGKYGQTDVPDYLNDRNAMHNAIITKFVTIELQQKFAMQLKSLVKKAPPFASRSWSDWDLITAALPQLSEAFLRTLGLWEETE